MISCEKAALICSKTQYREAGLREQIQLRLHLFVCKSCAAFSRKNKELSKLCARAALKTLSPEEKSRLKIHLNNVQGTDS
jgi:predicted metal-binding protein